MELGCSPVDVKTPLYVKLHLAKRICIAMVNLINQPPHFAPQMRKLVWQGGMPLLTILVKICFLFYTAASLTNLTNTEVMRCQAQRLSSDNPFPLTHVYQLSIHTHQDKVHPLLPKNTRLVSYHASLMHMIP